MKQGDIPNYIKAKSPMGLRSLMLQTNVKYGLTIAYFDIQFVSGYWFAWFYIQLQNDDELLNEKQSS